MKELSLNVLDIAMNSVKAKASLIQIHITEDDAPVEDRCYSEDAEHRLCRKEPLRGCYKKHLRNNDNCSAGHRVPLLPEVSGSGYRAFRTYSRLIKKQIKLFRAAIKYRRPFFVCKQFNKNQRYELKDLTKDRKWCKIYLYVS